MMVGDGSREAAEGDGGGNWRSEYVAHRESGEWRVVFTAKEYTTYFLSLSPQQWKKMDADDV